MACARCGAGSRCGARAAGGNGSSGFGGSSRFGCVTGRTSCRATAFTVAGGDRTGLVAGPSAAPRDPAPNTARARTVVWTRESKRRSEPRTCRESTRGCVSEAAAFGGKAVRYEREQLVNGSSTLRFSARPNIRFTGATSTPAFPFTRTPSSKSDQLSITSTIAIKELQLCVRSSPTGGGRGRTRHVDATTIA